MILVCTPYDTDDAKRLNLGKRYNEHMELLPSDEDYACLLDHDIMLTTYAWKRQIERAVEVFPGDAFTCMTNRMHAPWQVAEESRDMRNPDDIKEHRLIGLQRLNRRSLLDVTGQWWGGALMVIQKRAWRDAGGFVGGQLCVDHQMHRQLRETGRRVWCIEGLYIYHWRHAEGGGKWKVMPPIARNRATGRPCPEECAKPVPAPTVRVEL